MVKTFAIVPAAGRGVRMGKDKPKQFLELSGEPVLVHTLRALGKVGFLTEIMVVVPGEFVKAAEELVEGFLGRDLMDWIYPQKFERPCYSVVEGGVERQDSVYNALERVPPDCEYVLIHDGVRPLVSEGLLRRTWEAALVSGGAIAAVPSTDTVKRVTEEKVRETLPRDEIWLVQTPQVFRREILVEAYGEARRRGWSGTDDAAFVERVRGTISVVVGERANIKVTVPDDLVWAEWYLGKTVGSGARN